MAPLSISQLQERFMLEAAPHWHLYDARRSSTLVTKYRDDDPALTEEEKVEWAWQQLDDFLNMSPSGHARVVLKKTPSANSSKSSTYHVKWGVDTGRVGIGSTAGNYGSIGGTNEVRMMERMMKMMADSHATQMEMMKDVLSERFQRQNLEEQIEGMGAPSISENMLMGGLDILKTMVAQPRQQAALGTASTTEPVPPRDQQGGSQPEQIVGRSFSTDQALHDIGVLRKVLPQYHPNDVLKALAMFAASNPDQAGQYIGMLINSIPTNG